MYHLHPAIELVVEIGGYLAGIALVLWIIGKIMKANDVIEGAKHIPGGSKYIHPMEEEAEYEEQYERLNRASDA